MLAVGRFVRSVVWQWLSPPSDAVVVLLVLRVRRHMLVPMPVVPKQVGGRTESALLHALVGGLLCLVIVLLLGSRSTICLLSAALCWFRKL